MSDRTQDIINQCYLLFEEFAASSISESKARIENGLYELLEEHDSIRYRAAFNDGMRRVLDKKSS